MYDKMTCVNGFSMFSSLEKIDLYNVQYKILYWNTLREMSLFDCNIDIIPEMPVLEELFIDNCNVNTLYLGSKLDNVSIDQSTLQNVHINKENNITYLSLVSNNYFNKDTFRVSQFPKLETLYVLHDIHVEEIPYIESLKYISIENTNIRIINKSLKLDSLKCEHNIHLKEIPEIENIKSYNMIR